MATKNQKELRCFKVPARDYIKLCRNDKCLCNSQKKYKHCCLPKGIIFRLRKPEVAKEVENNQTPTE